MSVSKKKQSSSRSKRRGSHFALKPTSLAECTKCKKPIKPHHACSFCGTYNKKESVKIRPIRQDRELAKKAKSKKTTTKTKAVKPKA